MILLPGRSVARIARRHTLRLGLLLFLGAMFSLGPYAYAAAQAPGQGAAPAGHGGGALGFLFLVLLGGAIWLIWQRKASSPSGATPLPNPPRAAPPAGDAARVLRRAIQDYIADMRCYLAYVEAMTSEERFDQIEERLKKEYGKLVVAEPVFPFVDLATSLDIPVPELDQRLRAIAGQLLGSQLPHDKEFQDALREALLRQGG
ncbi:hypothetical protein D6833_09990 [Candidatus Parcubacteria bacterium]|nr:MAG: hypothetical protein D6833_09990 [Candidatus Parcubacteria bacterium]